MRAIKRLRPQKGSRDGYVRKESTYATIDLREVDGFICSVCGRSYLWDEDPGSKLFLDAKDIDLLMKLKGRLEPIDFVEYYIGELMICSICFNGFWKTKNFRRPV